MGYSAGVEFIYGYRAEMKEYSIPVKKYNEDTGEPYQTYKKIKQLVVKDTDIVIPEKLKDKHVFTDEPENGQYFFGIKIAKIDQFTPKYIEFKNAPTDVKPELTHLFDYFICDVISRNPKYYIYLTHSY